MLMGSEKVMKVLLAPDKFKGSLTAAEVADHLGDGLLARGISVDELPLADGGDGSVDAAVAAGFRKVPVTVAAATGRPHKTQIAIATRTRTVTAVVEVANTCGLHTLPGGRLAPLAASQPRLRPGRPRRRRARRPPDRARAGRFGQHRRRPGLLAALGVAFRDGAGRTVQIAGGTLDRIAAIDLTGLWT